MASRRIAHQSEGEQRPELRIGGAVEVLAGRDVFAAAEPARQKARLIQRISAVCRSQVASWVLNAAADLVVFHSVPIEDLDRILADIEAMRGAESLRDAARFFHAKVRWLAASHGAPWPRKSAAAIEARKADRSEQCAEVPS